MEKFNATLVVMAAGMGSRFGGLKQMEPVGKNGEAILDFSVYDAIKAGFNKVVFVIKQEIAEEFKNIVGKRIEKKVEVEYVYQEVDKLPSGFVCPDERKKPWGTGHAILCCKDAVTTPFAVINADDYYGRSAFQKIYEGLKNSGDNYCMVGFRLENTVTENGTVSRGVCSQKDGFLTDIKEYTKIYSDCSFEDENGAKSSLSPETIVSMNLWGFNTDIFDFLQKGFTEFLKENINVPKSEFYLPAMVDTLIKNGTKKAAVLVAEDKWYGVTYKEDKQAVVDAIASLVDSGIYEGI